jgi:ClpP class serine protease
LTLKYDASKPLRKFERTGILAVRPQAFFDFFAEPSSRANELIGDVEIVDVCGPVVQHDDYWTDSFDAILGRVVVACARQETKAIVLRLDSPGGDAQGCIDCARAIEAACALAGKPLYAYVDGQACSAAYALACVAERIYIGTTSFAGSIGVAYCREDVSARLANAGVRVAVIASGARKADGNPSQPITDDELRAQQELVDAMAGALFEHVAAHRGLAVEAVAGFDAKVFAGKSAIVAGLADEQAPLSALLVDIQNGAISMTAMEKARAALEEASKSDDAAVAKQARAALSAMDEKDELAAEGDKPPADEPDGDEPKDKPAAEHDEPDGDEEKPKDKAAARGVNAAAFKAVTQALAQSEAKVRKLEAEQATRERTELIASRPDLPAELVATFERLELAEIKAICKAVPKAALPLKSAVTTLPVPQGKRVDGLPGVGPTERRLPPELQARLDARMGLAPAKALINKRIGNTTFVGVPEDYQLPSTVDGAKG